MLIKYFKKLNPRLFCLLSMILAPLYSWAIDAPDVVYRVDFRPPEMIFANGFTARGHNLDLLTHIIGDSSRDGTDGLISTTSNWDSVRQLASDLLIPTGVVELLYIYTIRPSSSFYDINGSLLHANMVHVGSRIAGQSMYAYLNFGWQEEFASVGNIPTQQIREVQIARRVVDPDGSSHVLIEEEGFSNARYVDGTPSINQGYINATRDIEGTPVYTFGDIRRNPVQASFDSDGCLGWFVKRNISDKPKCTESNYSDYTTATLFKILSLDIL